MEELVEELMSRPPAVPTSDAACLSPCDGVVVPVPLPSATTVVAEIALGALTDVQHSSNPSAVELTGRIEELELKLEAVEAEVSLASNIAWCCTRKYSSHIEIFVHYNILSNSWLRS